MVCAACPGIPRCLRILKSAQLLVVSWNILRVLLLNGGSDEIYAGSADLMERNLLRRVETAFPVETNKIKERMKEELEIYVRDNTQA